MNRKMFAKILLSLTVAMLVLSPTAAFAAVGPCAGANGVGQCVVSIYRWSLGAAVLLALIMIIISGYLYITAGGNSQNVAKAKELFTGAFIGLIILFSAVLILQTINPDLVKFTDLKFPNIVTTP